MKHKREMQRNKTKFKKVKPNSATHTHKVQIQYAAVHVHRLHNWLHPFVADSTAVLQNSSMGNRKTENSAIGHALKACKKRNKCKTKHKKSNQVEFLHCEIALFHPHAQDTTFLG